MKEHQPFVKAPVPFDHSLLMETLETLTREYSFLEHQCIGRSIMGREIPLLRMGSGARRVLYVGTHHGMEWITALVLMRFVKDLCEHVRDNRCFYRYSPEFFLKTHSIYVLPMLNPDGVEYQIHGVSCDNPIRERVIAMNGGSEDFSTWQANARGVDLNHNYDAGFAEYKRLETENGITGGRATRFSGEFPESEPEVAALCRWIRFHEGLAGILTLHTQGKEIYYRSGGIELPKSRFAAQRISRISGYRLSDAEGLASFGGLTDWCVQGLGIPSFTLECGYGSNPLPSSDWKEIYCDLRRVFFTFPILL